MEQQHNHHLPQQTQDQDALLVKPVMKRYIILFLFCMNACCKAFQWMQVPSATTKATVLYGVDNYIINLASIIFMLSFVVLSWPACYIIEHLGMRRAVLMASFGTAVGAVVKCFSCHEEGVWLLMLGQIIVSLCEQLIFSLPSRIASVWFPDNQVSFCVAMCVVGNQFCLSWFYVAHTETPTEIGTGFYHMFLGTAGLSVAIFLLCVIAFDEEPKYAPGEARLKQRQLERAHKGEVTSMSKELGTLFSQMAELCKNRHLIMLSLSYGLVVGINYTIQTLLDQMLADADWPDEDLLVGTTGFIIIGAGIITTPFWGMIMDACHAYKLINVIIALGNVVSLACFSYAIVAKHSPISIYVSALFYGLFSVGFCVSALEYAVELTYPAPELVTSSIMNVMPQIGGTLCILLGSYLVDTFGNFTCGAFNSGVLLAGLVFVLVTKEDLKRQKAAAREKLPATNDSKLQEAVNGGQLA
uniref:Putative MFS-type transporter C09D4.1 n=1 Tax=Aceria tosichella TaxID=561515 RepID=A0A6G1SH90_9ACAR